MGEGERRERGSGTEREKKKRTERIHYAQNGNVQDDSELLQRASLATGLPLVDIKRETEDREETEGREGIEMGRRGGGQKR